MSERLEQLKEQLLNAVDGNQNAASETDPELNALIEAAKATPPDILKPAWSFAKPPEQIPFRIGPFEITGVLGSGGMGVVYKARQAAPLDRMVAVKVVRPELVSKSGLARFDLERAALGRLCHSNIAKILETGTCELDQPYIAMELVEGCNLLDYANQNCLSLNDRLQLFVAVCDAISHAHARGVIHRDLKPSNILVVEENGIPVPKVIDFGIAKVTDGGLGARLTLTNQVLGTLEYVSPEVIASGAMAADVRSDIYALGAVLYELVTNVPPVCLNDSREQGIMNALHELKDAVIERPSIQLSKSGSPHVAAHELGDLNCVIMHSLEKEPDHRYQSAGAFAEDIVRSMHNLPIKAAPPSTIKSLNLFVRRNWAMLAAVSGVFLIFAFGFTVTYLSYLNAERSRDDAIQSKQQAEDTIALFRDAVTATNVRDHNARVRLARLGERVEQILADEKLASPRTRFELQVTLGHSYSVTGKPDEAERILREAYRCAQQDWATSREKFAAARSLGEHLGKLNKLEEATTLIEEGMLIAEKIESPEKIAQCRYVFATLLLQQGKLNEAGDVLRSILESEDFVAEVEPAIAKARAQVMLASVLLQKRKTTEAIELARAGFETYCERRGLTSPATLMAGHNLATILGATKQDEEAVAIYNDILPARKTVLGVSHPDTLMTMTLLAMNLNDLGRSDEAEELFEKALELGDAKYRRRNPVGAMAATGLSEIKIEKGEFDSAIEFGKKTVEYAASSKGDNHWKVEVFRTQLAVAYLKAGNPKLAAELAQRARESLAKAVGESHPYTQKADEVVSESNLQMTQ